MSARRRKATGRRRDRQVRALDWSRLRAPALALVFGATAVGLIAVGLDWLDRPITAVVVEGPFEAVTQEQVRAAVVPAVEGGLLSVDIGRVRAAVESLAWVDRVRISRRWPDRLHVRVTEQVAAARWSGGRLINTRGELFAPGDRELSRPLPLLAGPEGTHWQVAQRYLGIRSVIAGLGVVVRELRLDPRRAWTMRVSGDLEVRLGRRATETRIARLRDVVLPLVARDSREAEYVDLRYTNGFAVRWSSQGSVGSSATHEPEKAEGHVQAI